MDLRNRTVVVTGANGALGRAVAQRAQALGAKVVLIDRQFAADLAASGHCHLCDLTDAAAVSAVWQRLGTVDVVCAVAGGFDMGRTVSDPDDTQWDAMFTLNVATLRNVLKAAIPAMRERQQGAVITVGALSAREGKAGMSAYTAAKAVVMNLTESIAAELAGSGVRANAVLPSIIDTAANRAAMPAADRAGWVSADALADAVCFLASDAARGITGALIPVTARQGR